MSTPSLATGAHTPEIVVYLAAEVVTMSNRNSDANAVAVRDERIVAVGSMESVKAALGNCEFRVESSLKDTVILPGLIDQHLHPILGASTLATEVIATEDWVLPERTFPAAHSAQEYRDRLKATLDATPDGWLFSWGYHSLWHGELNREILDSISSDRPIGVWQRSCHEFYLNSAAIDALDLSDDTIDTDKEIRASIDLDRGHFSERGFLVFLFPLLAPLLFHRERLHRGLRQMVSYLHQNGVTAFNEPGAILVPGAWELYEEILGDNDTPLYSFFLTDGRSAAEEGLTHAETLARAESDYQSAPTGKVSFLPKQVKLFADGAIISQLMQMNDPYLDIEGNPDPHHHGEWIMPPDVFEDRAKLYWDAGFQVHVHVNGDRGLDLVLDTFEKRMAENPRSDHRTVIVHFANSTEAQVQRIARLGAIVSSNPYYPVGFADKYGEVGLGSERADVMSRNASVVNNGIPLSLHSDLPMGPSNPLALMSFAVNRITQSGRVAGPEQRISTEQALRAVTIDAAHSWRREHELGSIEAGKIANFTVVDRNPLNVQPEELESINVLGTFFEGRWFPVPEQLLRRSAAANGNKVEVPGDHHGCVCDVARHIASALQQT